MDWKEQLDARIGPIELLTARDHGSAMVTVSLELLYATARDTLRVLSEITPSPENWKVSLAIVALEARVAGIGAKIPELREHADEAERKAEDARAKEEKKFLDASAGYVRGIS